jgi:hypothetical protein
MGDLDQAADAVAHHGVRANGAAMVEVEEDLQPAGNDVVRFAALDIGHKPYAARIMFVPRVIETLPPSFTHPGRPRLRLAEYALSRSCFRNGKTHKVWQRGRRLAIAAPEPEF